MGKGRGKRPDHKRSTVRSRRGQDEPVGIALLSDLVGRMVRIDEAEAMGILPQVGPRL